jgi:hypothetical protein
MEAARKAGALNQLIQELSRAFSPRFIRRDREQFHNFHLRGRSIAIPKFPRDPNAFFYFAGVCRCGRRRSARVAIAEILCPLPPPGDKYGNDPRDKDGIDKGPGESGSHGRCLTAY